MALDPGREKCGWAVLDSEANVLKKGIIEARDAKKIVAELSLKFKLNTIVLGKGTGFKKILGELSDFRIELVEEKNSTLEAKKRYFKENSPKGLLKFIPTSLLVPSRPVDDYAAAVLGERYLKG